MVCAAVVGDDVHNDLQPLLVGFGDIFLVLGVATETGINAIVVSASVAVVGLPVLVVHKERGAPNGCGTEVGDIIKMVDNSLKVTAMATERLLTVGDLKGVVGVVIAGIGIGKTVRIDKINEVGCRETRPFGGTRLPLTNDIGLFERLVAISKHKVVSPGLR